jgi:N-acetylglucosaminyltransferase
VTIFPIVVFVNLLFINRYFGGLWLKKIAGQSFDAKQQGYEPTVTVVIPMFNEGKGIYDTVCSLLKQEYPEDKLSIIVIDDCSTDDSYRWAKRVERDHPKRVRAIQNPTNMGKRRGINNAVRHATSEIIVSVDSDVVVHRAAVKALVARFTRPEIAAVGGRVNVSNPNENWLTRMQTIKYFFGYEYMKNLENYYSSVMCLSGCLTAYRRSVLVELEPVLESRTIAGVPIKYGEDRFLTRQIIKAGHQTQTTLDAVCWTVAPNTLTKYFLQQLRWRRSNAVDVLCGITHIWRLHPAVALNYLALFAVQAAYPVVLVLNLLSGAFWTFAAMNLAALVLFGVVYRIETRRLPAAQRVPAFAILPMVAVMPVTYLVVSPLALFTLDSSSWETRSHGVVPPPPALKPQA